MSVLLLLNIYQRPLGEVATSEQFAGELVRTLVGSIGLVLAVPLTTAIAVLAVSGGRRRRTDQIRPQTPTTPEPVTPPVVAAARRSAAEDEAAVPRPQMPRQRPRRSGVDADSFRRPGGPDEM